MTESQIPPSSTPPPTVGYGGYQGPPPDKDATNMAMLCHLLGIFTGFVAPLIIWLMKKDTSPFVDDQGKETLNFQIAAALVCIISVPLIYLFCLGGLIILAVQITRIVFGIMGTMAAQKGVAYRYPLTFRLIK